MKKDQAAVSLSYDATPDGLVTVKIRITYQRKQRRFSFPLKQAVVISKEAFKKLVAYAATRDRHASEDTVAVHNLIAPYIMKAETLVEGLVPFSFDTFKEKFYSDASTESEKLSADTAEKPGLIARLLSRAKELEENDQIGHSDGFRDSATSMRRFVESLTEQELGKYLGLYRGKDGIFPPIDIAIPMLTRELIGRYETWMLKFGKASKKKGGAPGPATYTTVGIYLSNVRTVMVEARESGEITPDQYPFTGRKSYTIPQVTDESNPLRVQDIVAIINYQPVSEPEQKAKDMWLFSCFSNGMNIYDVCNLKKTDMNKYKNTFSFYRSKTIRTRKDSQAKLVVPMFPLTVEIMERWTSAETSEYVFGFFNNRMDARRKKEVSKQLIKQVTKYMSRIGQKLGIMDHIVTYVARDSFATILSLSGLPIQSISDAIGHADTKTTRPYIGPTELERIAEALQNVLPDRKSAV